MALTFAQIENVIARMTPDEKMRTAYFEGDQHTDSIATVGVYKSDFYVNKDDNSDVRSTDDLLKMNVEQCRNYSLMAIKGRVVFSVLPANQADYLTPLSTEAPEEDGLYFTARQLKEMEILLERGKVLINSKITPEQHDILIECVEPK